MTNAPVISRENIDTFTRIIHFGLMLFGVLSLATGGLADDYKKAENLGYIIHSWIGISTLSFISLRVIYGFLGPLSIRFTQWVPYTRDRLNLVLEDIKELTRMRLPDRQPRQGLASLVEAFGILLFLFLSTTGFLLFLTIEPGHRAQGATHFLKELHEGGEILLILFFLVHGGAVILHAIAGDHVWKKMIFLKEK